MSALKGGSQVALPDSSADNGRPFKPYVPNWCSSEAGPLTLSPKSYTQHALRHVEEAGALEKTQLDIT